MATAQPDRMAEYLLSNNTRRINEIATLASELLENNIGQCLQQFAPHHKWPLPRKKLQPGEIDSWLQGGKNRVPKNLWTGNSCQRPGKRQQTGTGATADSKPGTVHQSRATKRRDDAKELARGRDRHSMGNHRRRKHRTRNALQARMAAVDRRRMPPRRRRGIRDTNRPRSRQSSKGRKDWTLHRKERRPDRSRSSGMA